MTKLRVIYKDDRKKLDTELDNKIQHFFAEIGFEWTGQGFDMESQERDISFVKED